MNHQTQTIRSNNYLVHRNEILFAQNKLIEIDKNSEIACIAVILDGVKRNPSELDYSAKFLICWQSGASDPSSPKNTPMTQVTYYCIYIYYFIYLFLPKI